MVPSSIGGFSNTVYSEEIKLERMANQNATQTFFSQPFELKGNRNLQVSATAPTVSNSWASLDFDLVDDQNNLVESIPVEVEYFSGTDSDGAWTEGSKVGDATVSALPAGKYVLRVQGTWQNWQQQLPVTVKIEQNVTRGVNFCLALVLLLIIPVLTVLRKFTFESKRWSESMFSSSG